MCRQSKVFSILIWNGKGNEKITFVFIVCHENGLFWLDFHTFSIALIWKQSFKWRRCVRAKKYYAGMKKKELTKLSRRGFILLQHNPHVHINHHYLDPLISNHYPFRLMALKPNAAITSPIKTDEKLMWTVKKYMHLSQAQVVNWTKVLCKRKKKSCDKILHHLHWWFFFHSFPLIPLPSYLWG